MHIGSNNPVVYSPQLAFNERAKNGGETQATPEPGQKNTKSANSQELSDEQRTQVAKLKSRDREVRAHEAAHLAAAGGLARGGASYSYTVGPDNRRYAVGGEVSIDTSPADTPEKTIQKAQTIQAAALAPAKPSSQDSAVAASAAQMVAQARADMAAERSAKNEEAGPAARAQAADSYTQVAAMDATNDKRIDLVI